LSSTATLDRSFAALADPTRRAIVARLAAGDATLTELAEPFDMTLPAVAKHIRVLERAGLLVRSRDAQKKPCRLEAARLQEVSDWAAEYSRIWAERFDRLDDYLRELQAKEKKRARKK